MNTKSRLLFSILEGPRSLLHPIETMQQRANQSRMIVSWRSFSNHYHIDRGFILTMITGDLLFCGERKRRLKMGFEMEIVTFMVGAMILHRSQVVTVYHSGRWTSCSEVSFVACDCFPIKKLA